MMTSYVHGQIFYFLESYGTIKWRKLPKQNEINYLHSSEFLAAQL